MKKKAAPKKATKSETNWYKKFWQARVLLRLNGFITDSENTNILKRQEAYKAKNNIVISNQELLA